MNYEVVTTCHNKGWQQYGRRMVTSFLLHWPSEVKLTLYAEGFEPEIDSQRCEVRELPKWQADFKARHASDKSHNGHRNGSVYSILFDAVRFSHKVAAVVDAAEHSQADVLIWVDADVFTHSKVSVSFLDSLAPTVTPIAWLHRTHKYPECGFVMYNLQLDSARRLLHAFREEYESDRVFKLPEWDDSNVLNRLVQRLGIQWSSLSGRYSNTGHPFINGPLGSVMDHLKGNRKNEGRSRRHDLRLRRPEPYWRAR